MILVFVFLYFLAKRYLLTDNVVKLKEFQQKKVAIAYSLPGTKGNWICFVNSYVVLSFKFSLFLSLFSLSFNVSEKLRWFVLSFLVYPDRHLSSHSLLLQSLQLSFYSFTRNPREILKPVLLIHATQGFMDQQQLGGWLECQTSGPRWLVCTMKSKKNCSRWLVFKLFDETLSKKIHFMLHLQYPHTYLYINAIKWNKTVLYVMMHVHIFYPVLEKSVG